MESNPRYLFEEWLREHHPQVPILTVSAVDDRYLSPDASRMWQAWQAAWNTCHNHSPDAGKMGEEIFWHAGTQRPEPMTCDETGCTTGLVLVIHAPDDGGPSVRQGRYDHCLRGFFDSTTSQRIDPDQWTFAPQEAARAGERGPTCES